MRLLIDIPDVRLYRQLSKQLNEDNFEGRVREVQENELTELLNRALTFDFFNSLENGWSTQAGTFVRDSDRQFTATALDLSAWVGYALKINDTVFGVVKTAVFSTNTIITLTDESTSLPTTISTVEFKTDAKYIKLLNGTSYTKDSNTIQYNGIKPFITWKLLAIFMTDANTKLSDTGSFTITSANFRTPSAGEINAAKSTYLQNSTREENHIIDYLNTESTDFTLWNSKGNENIENFNIMII